MANPWDNDTIVTPAKPAAAPWAQDAIVKAAKPAQQRWSGGILPVSEGPDGKPQFDSNAGLIGGLKRAVTLPGRVASGEVDPLSREGMDQAMEMAGVFSPMNPAIRAGGFAVPGVKSGLRPAKVEPPTAEVLKEAAGKGYDAVRDMGVQYSTDAVTRHVGGIRAALEQDGILGELAPKTFAILSKFDNPPANSVVTSAGLEAARRAAGNAAKDFANPTEQLAARRLVEALDGFVASADPRSVVAGPAAAAAEGLAAARGNYAAASRSEKLAGVEERADLQAARANSGFNTDNAVRQRADELLRRPRESAGFNAEEREALKQIIKGGLGRNTLRTAGNLMGGGGGLGAAVSGAIGGAAGGAMGGPVGIAIGAATPLAGMAAKGASNRLALRELGQLDLSTRMRSPLYQEMLGQAPLASDWRLAPGLNTTRAGSLAALGQSQSQQMDPGLRERLLRVIAEGGA